MTREAFFCECGGRDDDGTAGTESEVEYWAVCFGESVEETVDWRFDEAMVANNGERVRRRRREVETLRFREDEFISNEKESYREYHIVEHLKKSKQKSKFRQ